MRTLIIAADLIGEGLSSREAAVPAMTPPDYRQRH